MKKCEGKKFWFLIEVHFLIAAPNGHPSKYWLGSMLLNFRATKWSSKKVGFLPITFFVIMTEWKWTHFCDRIKKLVNTLITWLWMKSSYSKKALLNAKLQKKPRFSPKEVIKNFYLWCHLITPIVVWAGPITIGLVHFFILPNTVEAHCDLSQHTEAA